MKYIMSKICLVVLIIILTSVTQQQKKFQGKAYYFSKSSLDLGTWGAKMSEAQKKQRYV